MKSQTSSSASDAMEHNAPSSLKTQIIAPSLSFENHKLRNLINKSRHPQMIISLLTKSQESNIKIDAATFGKAMQKCNDLKQFKHTIEIMDIFLNYPHSKPSIVEFNILFNGLCSSKLTDEYYKKYFEIMTNEYKIAPDIITFCALIKGCRDRALYDIAQNYWDLMITEYQITPNEIAYTELMQVYSMGNKKHAVIELFNEYLTKVKQNELMLNEIVFQTYLNTFARVSDVNGMLHALDLLTNYGIKYNPIIYMYIMRGYLKARKQQKAIDTFNDLVQSGVEVQESHFFLKCVALVNLMKLDINNFDAKHEIYQEIQNIMNVELEQYGFKASPIQNRLLLSAAIILYHNHEPMKIVEVFEEMINKGIIGIRNDCKYNGKMRLDLHCFEKADAQFIVRYIIAFELSETEKCEEWLQHENGNGKYHDYLIILTGKGMHASGRASYQANLREFMVDELLSYNPPIKCEIDRENTGQLKIHKDDLKDYIVANEGEMNHAMKRLIEASNDWYMDDVDERKKLRKPNVEQYCYNYNRYNRWRKRSQASRKKLNQFTSTFSEGKEIELFDENCKEWNQWIIKKHVKHTDFILYNTQRKIHKNINLGQLLQVS